MRFFQIDSGETFFPLTPAPEIFAKSILAARQLYGWSSRDLSCRDMKVKVSAVDLLKSLKMSYLCIMRWHGWKRLKIFALRNFISKILQCV